MGAHLWSEASAEQNMFDTNVFAKKYKKELLQKCYGLNYGILRNLHIHPPTLRLRHDHAF